MIFSALKYLVNILICGGLVAPFIAFWLRRRDARVQTIPLIERVNRLVDPRLDGFTLARVVQSEGGRRLEEVQSVREFQLTLKNTSTVHLQNCEIQFEFPTADVEAWAERPIRSKTAPVLVEAVITPPWRKGYRWRIPEFPSTDSIEFTFRAIGLASDDYEVALYNAGKVVIEKSKGEPPTRKWLSREEIRLSIAMAFALALLVVEFSYIAWAVANPSQEEKATVIEWAGCSLDIQSSFNQVNPGNYTRRGPWSMSSSILNTGTRKCFVQSGDSRGGSAAIDPSQTLPLMAGAYTRSRPRLVSRKILFGPDRPINEATVMVYEGTDQ